MKFKLWYEKHRPVLLALSLLWFIPCKYRKPIQQLIKVIDTALATPEAYLADVPVE
jgi:hypothetical protein